MEEEAEANCMVVKGGISTTSRLYIGLAVRLYVFVCVYNIHIIKNYFHKLFKLLYLLQGKA